MFTRSMQMCVLGMAILCGVVRSAQAVAPQAGSYIGKFTGTVSTYQVTKGTPLKLTLAVTIQDDGAWGLTGVDKDGNTVLQGGNSISYFGSANIVLWSNSPGQLITVPLHIDSDKGKATGSLSWVVTGGTPAFYEGKVSLKKE